MTEQAKPTEIRPTRQERAWLKRLEKLVASQPPGTHVFVHGGGWGASINLLRLGPDGQKVVDGHGSFDQAYVVGLVNTTNWDGGGW